MALSRLRIEAQKERNEEEKKRREAAGQTIGEASRLRQEAQKEQEAKKAAGIPTSLPTFSELRASGGESLRNREILQSASRNANRNPVTAQTPDDSEEQLRDANLKDILWNSLKQGYYNSRYGEESYDRMMGVDNEADKYRDILAGDDYRFRTDNAFEQAVSGAMTQIGQMARQYTNPRSLGMATAAGGAALLAGQAGPQVLAPEELLTVPGAMALGFQTGSAMSNFEIEGGLAYQEMLELGVSPETARVIGLAVGGGNAALEALQLDELMDGLKVAKKTGGMDNAAGVIWDVIKKRFPGVANNVAQEVGQEGVTIGGAQLGSLIDKGEWAYDAGEVVNRLGDTALSSMLTFSAMDVPGASMNVAAQLNANKQYGKIGADYQASAEDLVNEGLSFAPDTEAHKTAQEVKVKMDAGESVTDADLGRVVVANERTMQQEERLAQANRPAETLEEVAREAVQAEQGVSVEADTQPTLTEKPTTEPLRAKQSVPYNVMAESNPVRRAVVAEKTATKKRLGYGKEGVKLFNEIAQSSGMSETELMVRFDTPYQVGLTGLEMDKAKFVNDFQVEAYNAGRMDHIARMTKDGEHKLGAVLSEAESGFDFTGAPKSITQAERKFGDFFLKKMGVKGSWDGQDGKAAYNAFYDSSTGGVTFAQDFGIDPELMEKLGSEDFMKKVEKLESERDGSFVFYLAHEVATHVAMNRAPKEMRAFANAMYNYKQGLTTGENLARGKQAFYASKKVALDTEGAIEEVVADAILELYHGDEKAFMAAMERIANGKDEQVKKGARMYLERLKEAIAKLKAWAKKLVGRENAEARAKAEQGISELEQLRDMFEQAIGASMKAVEAKRAKTTAVSENGTNSVVRVGDESATYEENGKVYSLKSLKHDVTEGKMFDDLVAAKVFTRKEADLLKENLTKLVGYMVPNANILDMNEEYTKDNRPFSSYKPNSDPLYLISLDFSTLCRKRLMTQYVIEQLQLKENRPMSAEEQIAIRSMLLDYRRNEKALQVACAMCYVEAARLKAPKQIERFFNDTESIMRKHFAKKDKEFNAKVVEAQKRFKVEHGYDENAPKKDMKSKDQKALNDMSAKMRKEYVPGAEQQAIIDVAVKLPRSKFLTAANITELSIDHPEIYDAYTSHIRASTRSKSLEGDVPYYYGDSKGRVTDAFIDSVNAENGMRFDSWSDFQMKHMLDMITAVIDLSVRGSKMHGYTKFPEMVRIFGKTGMMFNLSGVTEGNGFDADGNLRFSDTESIDIKQAIQLRNDFPETAGLQCIGVSDDHIRTLLRADYIDYVIPYHTSGMNATLRRMAGIHKWKDYTKTQHATKDPKAKKPAGAENWQVEPTWSEFYVADGKDGIDIMKKTAQRYIDMCHERGLIPKFNDFINEDGYWKLLVDRKMVNQKTGKIIEQQAVKPIFDFDLIQREIDNEVSQYDPALEKRALKYVVDNFDAVHQRIRDLKKGHPKKPMLKMANEILQAYAEGSKRSAAVTVQSAATEAADGNVQYSLRTKPAPKKTVEVYKLMRLENGAFKPLFIDSTEELTPGLWYDADSPNLDFLKKLPSGIFLVDANRETYTTFDEYLAKSGEKKTKYPSKKAIEKAASEGKRWVYIEDVVDKSGKPKQQRRYGGETRKYWNLGINGSGAVNVYAMRPGYHAGSLPTMRQIGKGPNKDLRDDTFVWTVGEVPADIDYQAEANRNPDKDIPTHIPVDGYYLKATNADKAKSQADVMGWYVAGSYKINRIISDAEARSIIDKWNAEHPDAQALYDYERESGMDFDADQMKLVPKNEKTAAQQGDGEVKFALKNVNGKQVVWVENSALSNKQLKDRSAVAAYIAQHIGEVYTIIESGKKVYIGKDLPGEYTRSKYSTFLYENKSSLYNAKGRAANELGLLIETATNRRWESTKHTHSKDAKYGMYRYDSSFAFPVKDRAGNVTNVRAYDVELLIRNASDGKKYLYDIVGIKENTTSASDLLNRETRLATYKAAQRGSASNPSVAPQEDSVKGSEQYSLKIDTSSMSEDGKEIVKRLKTKAMGSKYLGGYASYTYNRMNREIAKSIYRGNADGATSHIAWIDPLDYIYATTTSQEGRDHLKKEAGKLDLDRIRAEDQPIYLHVNMETGEIVGHEGRHRMLALRDAGVNRAAVVIYWSGTDNRDMQPITYMKLKGQNFGFGRGVDFSLTDALPLSERYADAARALFSEVEGSTQFSLKGEQAMRKEINRIRTEGAKAGKSESEIENDIMAVVGPEYGELIKTYGEIKRGERAAREIEVPRKTEEDRHVSQTIRTVLEAEATPDAAVPTIQQLIAQGDFSYDVITDKSAMAGAEKLIRTKGYETVLAEWVSDVKDGKVSKANTAIGWALYNQAANAGDLKTAMTILDGMIKHQRNAAQAVQATRILKKMSPDAQLYGVKRSVDNLKEELIEKYGKKAPDLEIDEELARKLLKAKTDEEQSEAMRELYQDIGKQIPASFVDKWNAWRYLAMLGNPRTHVRNVVGNLGFAPVVVTKDLTATAIESVVGFVSRGKMGRTKAMPGAALLKAAWDDYANVASEISGSGKYNDAANKNQAIEDGRVIFKTKPLEKARKANSAALEMEDMWFAKPHYAFALAQYCKAHGVTADQLRRGKALGNARAYAIKEAQKATYRDTNAFSETISELGRYHGDNAVKKGVSVVMEGILPFRKTPANILVRGLEYSPMGLVKGLTWDLAKVKKGDITAADAIDNIAAGLTGTGLLAFGLWAAAEGLIRGAGGDDEDEKKFEELQGHQSYALELPDGTSVTLDWLAPEALPVFIGVNLYEMARDNKGKSNLADILTAVSNVTEPLLEMSCLQSLNDLFDSVGYATSGGLSALPSALASAATSYLTQAFPTILGQAERSAQDVRMTTYTEKDNFLTSDLQYTLGKISAKIPGWDFQQIPYVDAWGRTESTGSRGENAANNFLNPAYTSQIETSAMEEELQRLYDVTGEKGVLPDRAEKKFTVNKEDKHLTAEEYVKYATERGQMAYDLLTDLTSRPEYRAASDEEKVEIVDKAYDYATAVAKSKVSDYKPTGWVAKAIEAEKVSGMDETEYMLYELALSVVDQPNKNGEYGGTPTQEEKAAAIASRRGLSDKDIAFLWDTNDGYDLLDAGIDMRAYVEYVGTGGSVNAEKLIDIHSKGIGEETYFDFLDTLKDVDQPTESGKLGSYTQDEATAAIKAMSGLSRAERAALWQSVNKSWKAKNNPWR